MAGGRKRALLIGNGSFADERLARLFAPPDDVEALKTVLLDTAIGAFDSVEILTDRSLLPVRRTIAKLCANSAPDDLILLYYTGHGVLTFHNDLYLAVHETTIELSEADGLGAAWVRERLEQSRARRQVLILDCCHSGAFMAGRKDAGVRAVTTETFGLGHGRYVLTASDAQSFAWDAAALKEGPYGTEGETSLFTRLLVQGLATGAAAPDPDKEIITVHNLYAYVYNNLPPDAQAMSPQIFVDRGAGDLVLAHNPARLRPELRETLGEEDLVLAVKRNRIMQSVHDAAWKAFGFEGLRGQKHASSWVMDSPGPGGIRIDAYRRVYNAILQLTIASDPEATALFPENAQLIPQDPKTREEYLTRLTEQMPVL